MTAVIELSSCPEGGTEVREVRTVFTICQLCGRETRVAEINHGPNEIWEEHVICSECGYEYYC